MKSRKEDETLTQNCIKKINRILMTYTFLNNKDEPIQIKTIESLIEKNRTITKTIIPLKIEKSNNLISKTKKNTPRHIIVVSVTQTKIICKN